MATFKVLFCFSLHALFLISSSATRLFHPFSVADQALIKMDDQTGNDHHHKLEINIDTHFQSKQFSDIRKYLTLAKQQPWTDIVSVRNQEMKRVSSSNSGKRALIEEAKEAIKASIRRHDGVPFESKRLSPGGPDPHHH